MMKKVLMAMCIAVSAVATAQLSNGIVASYTFNGNTNDDISGINGTLSGGATLIEDRFGNDMGAVNLQNGGQFINMGASILLEMTDAYTVSMWIDQDGIGSGGNGTATLYNREGEYEAGLKANGELMVAHSTTAKGSWAWVDTGVLLDSTVWSHIAFTFGGDSSKVYVNGAHVFSVYEPGTIDEQASNTFGQDDFQIGARQAFPGAANFNGKVDDVNIYVVALEGDAIKELYETQKMDTPKGLVAAYKLDGNVDDTYMRIDGEAIGGTYVANRFNEDANAIYLNGTTDYLNLTSSTGFEMTTEYSISMWLDQDGIGNGGNGTATLYNREGEYEAGLTSNGELLVATSTTSKTSWAWIYSGVVVDSSKWNHVAFTFGSDSIKVYLNGEKVFSAYEPGTIDEIKGGSIDTNPLDQLQFGGRQAFPDAANYNGKLDDIKIYNIALTDNDIQAIYDNESIVTGFSFEAGISLDIFPNPASNNITVSGLEVQSMELISLSGGSVKSVESNQMNIEEVENGMYLLKVLTTDGDQVVERIVKN